MTSPQVTQMGLLPDVQNCWLRMRRECRERFPCHQLKRKPLVSDPGMHHGTCVTHGPWYMSGSLTRDGGKNAPGIPGACAIRNFTYLVRGPWVTQESFSMSSLCGIQIDNANNNNNDNNTPIHLNNDYNFMDSSMTYIYPTAKQGSDLICTQCGLHAITKIPICINWEIAIWCSEKIE